MGLERHHLGLAELSPAASPAPRNFAGMAYDTATSQMLLFGGYNGSGNFADTWAWNGTTWGQLSPVTSPGARSTISISYDTSTLQMVLFGGYTTGYIGDTWIMGAPTVTAVSPTSGPTAGGTWVTITGTGFNATTPASAVMFGTTAATGVSASSPTSITAFSPAEAAGLVDVTVTSSGGTSPKTGADQFTYANTNWYNAAPPTVPPPRSGAVQAYDTGTGQMVMFGGYENGAHLNDTWAWNGSTWTQLFPALSPPVRGYASMAYDPDMNAGAGALVLFGGWNGSFLNDTWAWNGTSWSEVATTGPPVRDEASMAWDPVMNAGAGGMVLFGGAGSTNYNDTWSWSGTTWTQLSPTTSPSARGYSSLAYDTGTQQMVLYGGYGTTYDNDTWLWDGSNWDLQSPGTSPGARDAATMAYDSATGQLLLAAGSNGSTLGDTWNWTGSTWAQLAPTTTLPARWRATMAYDVATSQMVLFGGWNSGNNALADTWIIGAPSVTLVSPGSGPAGTATSVTITGTGFNATTPASAVMFGPTAATGVSASSSTSITATAPAEAAGTVDVTVTSSGGTSPDTSLDQYTYTGGLSWYQAAPTTSPTASSDNVEAFDPATGQTILFVGFSASGGLSQTWDWTGSKLGPAQPPDEPLGTLGGDDGVRHGHRPTAPVRGRQRRLSRRHLGVDGDHLDRGSYDRATGPVPIDHGI